MTPTSGWATYIVMTVSCVFCFCLRGHNIFSTGPIELKFGTYVLDVDTSGPFFFLGDPRPSDLGIVGYGTQVEIRQNRYKILLSGPIELKIRCELADL